MSNPTTVMISRHDFLTPRLPLFSDSMSSKLLEHILEDVCLLLRSRSREVVQGALAFTKVLVATHDTATLAPHLKPLVSVQLQGQLVISELMPW